jgi:hypothetical protein
MKTISYFILTGLALLCFLSVAIMIRECTSLTKFQFIFLWACMCISAMLSLVLIKNLENKF